jgi:signal transduction histidine kinase
MGSTLAVVTVFSSATMERLRASLEAELALRKKIDHQERLAIIGEVVAGVVHELSSPLNGIRNSFRALLRDPEGFVKRGDILRLMNEALERMAAISRRLLTLARDPQLDKQPLVVNEVVERGLAELQHRVDSTGVSLQSRLAPRLPPILADSIAVGEVITNLVSNALDAVEGGGRVTVETSHGHGDIEIRVMDTGRGIPPSMRARLFEPFQSTKPVGKGTGLGLAISKRLVEAHGGSITVASDGGQGTTVTVRLPVRGREGP